MSKIKNFIWIVFLVVSFYAESTAQYYQYIDQDGNISFTDNLTDIPKDQLDQIKTFESVETKKPLNQGLIQIQGHSGSNIKPDEDTWDGKLRSVAEKLEQRKELLDKTYIALQQEKKQLQGVQINHLSLGEKRMHEKKGYELNIKIKNYQNKCDALKVEIEKFYQQL